LKIAATASTTAMCIVGAVQDALLAVVVHHLEQGEVLVHPTGRGLLGRLRVPCHMKNSISLSHF